MSIYGESRRPGCAGSPFAPTRWTLVLRARDGSDEARAALSELCAAYYEPVLAFIRRDGRDEDAARDLTQAFFHRLIAQPRLAGLDPSRGRFRSYLLGAVKHFLGEERQRACAAKRGGGKVFLSIEANASVHTSAELQIADPAATVGDTWFDRQWAANLVNRAVAALAVEATHEGKREQFDSLKGWLVGETSALSYREKARALGLNESAVKVAVHRLRRRFREVVKAEIAHTVGDPKQAGEELRYLVEVLSQPPPA